MMVSVAELRRDADASAVDKLQFAHWMWRYQKPTYAEWVQHVEDALVHQVTEMVRLKHHVRKHGEDGLTAQVLQGLRMLSLDARMEAVGGNCDVTVSFANEYLWLGEAKLATGPEWVFEGYNQLTTRYATGLPNQSAGGMLIYCTQTPSNVFMAQWRASLEADLTDSVFEDHGTLASAFWNTDRVPATGEAIRVLHLPFPLFQAPQEGIRKFSDQARKAGRKARKAAKNATSGPDKGAQG